VTTELAELEAAAKQPPLGPGPPDGRQGRPARRVGAPEAPARPLAGCGRRGRTRRRCQRARDAPGDEPAAGTGILGQHHAERLQARDRAARQAADLVNQDNIQAALVLYRKILAADPNQPRPRRKWLARVRGRIGAKDPKVVAQGRALVNRAIAADPSSYASHLFLGTIILQQDHDAAAAVAQYKQFLADNPR